MFDFKKDYYKYPFLLSLSIPAIYLVIGLIAWCLPLIVIALVVIAIWLLIMYFVSD
jgi:hypothetical protein